MLQGQNTHAAFRRVDDHQCPRGKFPFVLSQRGQYRDSDVLRQHAMETDLDDTRLAGVCQGQRRTEIQIMSENRVIAVCRLGHDRRILRARIADRRPMNCRPTCFHQQRHPFRGEIHVDDDPKAHEATRSSSRSSNRHAA